MSGMYEFETAQANHRSMVTAEKAATSGQALCDAMDERGPLPTGIDPGKTGYVVVLLPDGALRTWAVPMLEYGKAFD